MFLWFAFAFARDRKIKEINKKMCRQSNFSTEEVAALIAYLERSPGIILGEYSKNNKDIDEEWENIAVFVNSCGLGHQRTGDQVRKKWTDLKYRTKRKASGIDIDEGETGGGPPGKGKLNALEKRVIALIGTTCIEGVVPNSFDSTSYLLKENKSAKNKTAGKSKEIQANKSTGCSSQGVHILSPSEDENEEEDMTYMQTPKNSKQVKRKCSSSTERVQKFREKKMKEEELLEKQILDNQEAIASGVTRLTEKCDMLIENQKEILLEIKRSNQYLDVMSQNLETLVKIGAHFIGVPVSESNQ